jgi:pimeloyl-ACP methyl ester carboxylesterase
MHLSRRSLIAGITLAAFAITAAAPSAARTSTVPEASIILVHGAFGDGSAWRRVIPLIASGTNEVIAVQLPLSSLADDTAVVHRAIARARGPVVLVGHSWGGTVITEAGDADKVRALVYIAAFANRAGESAAASTAAFAHAPGLDALEIDAAGFARLSADGIARFFAPQASPSEQQVLAAAQGPIRLAAFGEPVTAAAWTTKPSWAIITADDQMIVPAAQEAMAQRIGAKTIRIKSDHAAMISHPAEIAQLILAAAAATRDP